jgi:hypothetical protein
MLARLRNVPTVTTSPIFKRYQPVLGLDLSRLFASSQTRSKFARPDPTDAELLEMSPDLRYYYKTRHDPVARLKRVEAQRLIDARLKQQRKDDPEFKQQEQARWRAGDQRQRMREDHAIRHAFRLWLQRIPKSQREAYSCKTHLPVIFPESQLLTCSVCSDYPAKSRLWWKLLDHDDTPETSGAEVYMCHSCYMDQDMSQILPSGLENHVIGSGKRWPKP